jgi:hypothetical protein
LSFVFNSMNASKRQPGKTLARESSVSRLPIVPQTVVNCAQATSCGMRVKGRIEADAILFTPFGG